MENQVNSLTVDVWEATPAISIVIFVISQSMDFQKIEIQKLVNY